MDHLQQWLSGARLRGCANGRRHTARVRRPDSGTAEVPNGPGAQRVRELDGSVSGYGLGTPTSPRSDRC